MIIICILSSFLTLYHPSGVREIKSKIKSNLGIAHFNLQDAKTFDEGDEMIAWEEMDDLKKRVRSRKTDE
jgi:hypothetical protein